MNKPFMKGKTKYGTTVWVFAEHVCGDKVVLYDGVLTKSHLSADPKIPTVIEVQVRPEDIELDV